ncbi:NAD-dependent methanol dehydrogenase [Caulifigura coniformis]|uniref:NAD-dependent methanol dehydrogenase n=1 Tax=Caulifigura coniformis TaxID=2527983 RepID=A0A517SH20_9PLAN|nr:iron-containing alcohol dehydrogenase [Caulifigura coniformis]QDT55397.1 NAD-dependent methanol dehydrogenase [Caulifigura coniformis]
MHGRTSLHHPIEPGELSFELRVPAKVVFGWGKRSTIGEVAASLGRRAWIVAGSRTLEAAGVPQEMEKRLAEKGIETRRVTCASREPETSDVDEAVAAIRPQLKDGDCLIAVGGGSTIDLAKAVAGLVTQRETAPVRDYLEGVGRGLKLVEAPLPLIAVPTTSGTGTEATKNAVISSYDPLFKKSLRDERLVPSAVLIDPELTVSNSPEVTAHSGMDAITQLIESYVTKKATRLTKALCREGLRAAIPAIEVAYKEPTNRAAREAMSYAAWLSGVTLANSGLGMAHGVAAALGVHCKAPHGLACAVMLVPSMKANLQLCYRDFAQIGELIAGGAVGSDEMDADLAIVNLEMLATSLGIPKRLRELGVREDQLAPLVAASRGNSMSGNPRDLSDNELLEVLTTIW